MPVQYSLGTKTTSSLVLALKCDGALDSIPVAAALNEVVAHRLGLERTVIEAGLKKRLVSAGLIESNWQPVEWKSFAALKAVAQ